MKSQFFSAVSPLHSAFTVGTLAEWIERYVNVVLPDNAVEYWSVGVSSLALHAHNDLPKFEDVKEVMVSVSRGSCEGHRLRANLLVADANGNHVVRELCSAKAFGRPEHVWKVAHAVSDALESIFNWQELPEIVAMSDAIPRAQTWRRETSLTEPIVISVSEAKLRVATQSGDDVLHEHDFAALGDNARFAIEPRVADWKTVLTNTQAEFVVQGV